MEASATTELKRILDAANINGAIVIDDYYFQATLVLNRRGVNTSLLNNSHTVSLPLSQPPLDKIISSEQITAPPSVFSSSSSSVSFSFFTPPFSRSTGLFPKRLFSKRAFHKTRFQLVNSCKCSLMCYLLSYNFLVKLHIQIKKSHVSNQCILFQQLQRRSVLAAAAADV